MVKSFRTRGFTIIEVSLFLALSGLLMVGLIAGTNASISRQRYNDAVNNFAEYLRTAYNDVANISTDNAIQGANAAGRSKYAVYGKLITIGEGGTGNSQALAYDVVGYAVNSSNIVETDTISVLSKVGANIVYDANESLGHNYKFYRQTTYTAPWDASLERPDGRRHYGIILIIRSPVSGIIQTYSHTYSSSTDMPNIASNFEPESDTVYRWFNGLLSSGDLVRDDVDICVDSEDNNNGRRRDVRIQKYAVNSSGVTLTELNSDTENPCGSDFAGDVPE